MPPKELQEVKLNAIFLAVEAGLKEALLSRSLQVRAREAQQTAEGNSFMEEKL